MEIESKIPDDADSRISLQIFDMCLQINDHNQSRKLADMQLTATQFLTEAFTNYKAFKELDIDSSGVKESYELAVYEMLELCFDPRKDLMDLKLRTAKLQTSSSKKTRVAPKPQGSKRKKDDSSACDR